MSEEEDEEVYGEWDPEAQIPVSLSKETENTASLQSIKSNPTLEIAGEFPDDENEFDPLDNEWAGEVPEYYEYSGESPLLSDERNQDNVTPERDEEEEVEGEENEFQISITEDLEDEYSIEAQENNNGVATTLPKMGTRFYMSNEQILNLIDPHNQSTFESNIARVNLLLESNQKEYCLINNKAQNPDTNEFRLSRKLLGKLVYGNELDLAGNFLHQTVGRRLNDKDMPELAEFLTKDSNVTKLNLSYNDFGDEAVAILAGVLLARIDICDVNLANNDITPAGCFHFIQGLMTRSGPPLRSLKLAGNKIGKEGFDGLVCLIMCGRGPHDLDVSETDMTMEHFQGLCSAWQALDRDEDSPKFLKDHPPPIPLEVLADMKAANNEIKRQEYSLIQRKSLVELIRKDAGDMMTEMGMQKLPDFPKDSLPDSLSVVEKVSATILEGLFEIPELKLLDRGDVLENVTLDRGQNKIDKIIGKTEKLPDTALLIEEYKKIKDAGCIPIDAEGRPVIVCPSLYSLDLDNVLEEESEAYVHFIPSPLIELVEGAKEMSKSDERNAKAPNQMIATKAATKVVDRALQEAARLSSMTDYAEKSDATQILLSTVLATCQKVRELGEPDMEFKKEALQQIWELATQQAAAIIYNRVPPEKCSLTPEEVMAFVRKFMESSNRTLLRLLENPFIPPLLFNVGTRACKEIAEEDANKRSCSSSYLITNPSDPIEPNNAQKIVMSFLEGAISTAANLIGTGDPFSFRKQAAQSLESALEKSGRVVDETEGKVQTVVENMILAGASLALEAQSTHKKLDITLDKSIDPAIAYLEEAFDQVAHLVIEMDNRRKDLFEDKSTSTNKGKSLKFAFVSRPHRLVINRPLFQDFEAIMSAKMGDFLRINTSVKCLHMRKWNFGEEGMINLMDGLSENSNIVLLDLGLNAIGPEGARALAKFIRQNPNLKHLILNHNRLRNPGLSYMTDALLGSNIEFLNISYNDITESLEQFLEILPQTRIRSLYALGNHFNQNSWELLKSLFDVEWLIPEYCDMLVQDVDGNGMIVRNSQARDINEWYDVQPLVPEGLHRAPYFEETAHIDALMSETD